MTSSTTSLEGIIVVATDRTDELRFERLAKQEQAFSRLIIKILKTPTSFIKLYRHAERISGQLKKLEGSQLEKERAQILRELHGLKGAFSFYDFYELRDILHDLESQLLTAHSPLELEKKVEELTEKLNHFRLENADIFERLILSRENELQKKYKFLWAHDFPVALKNDYVRELCFTPASESLRFLTETAQELALKYQKDLAPIELSGQDIPVSPEVHSILFECAHLIRNSVIHGIEDAPTRQKHNKPKAGKISISLTQLATDEVRIVISDDGKGFDAKAFKDSGFQSTKDVVTTDSGRGLGVNAVFLAVKKLNGTVQWESRPGQGTSFSFNVPLREPSPNTDLASF
jgi:chemotaxis protein histidine kinase CheA